MRLVAWNANYNRYKRSLEEDAAILQQFHPDVLVISEAAPPRPSNPCGAMFTGGTPGLAVIAGQGVAIAACEGGVASPKRSLGLRITAPWCFDIIAVWPVSDRGKPSYHEILMAALEHFAPLLINGRAILAGDLNSSSRVLAQKRSHAVFVSRAAELGVVSAYHACTGEAHGEESLGTYRHGASDHHGYHLDYCFVSHPLLPTARFCICDDPVWDTLSDHRPIVLDVDEPRMPSPIAP
jgi:exonuclease III